MMKILTTILCLFAILAGPTWGQKRQPVMVESYFNKAEIQKYNKPYNSGIGDYENILTEMQKNEIDSIIKVFGKETSNQIALVSIDSLGPYKSLMEFTTDLGNYWGVGQKEKNNGLVITISKKMHQVWIGTGYGTEKILSDTAISHIIDSLMIPYFKQGKFFEGIKSGMLGCIDKWTKK
jgi:uncharacterized protein